MRAVLFTLAHGSFDDSLDREWEGVAPGDDVLQYLPINDDPKEGLFHYSR